MGKVIKMKIGKYDVSCELVNEPSEEAISRCRKIINEVMREYLSENK